MVVVQVESLGIRIKRYENKAKPSLRGLRVGSTDLWQRSECRACGQRVTGIGHKKKRTFSTKMESLPKNNIKKIWQLKKQNTEVIPMILQIDTGKYLE